MAQHAVAQQDVDNACTEVDPAQAALGQAKKDLDDTDVRAEIDKQVGRTLLEVGARVTGPADLLTTIDRLDPVYVTFRPSSAQLLEWQQFATELRRSGLTIRAAAVDRRGWPAPRCFRVSA